MMGMRGPTRVVYVSSIVNSKLLYHDLHNTIKLYSGVQAEVAHFPVGFGSTVSYTKTMSLNALTY